MSTDTESPYPTTLQYFTSDGSAIHIDPLPGPSMVFGQHGRLVVPALLNARFIDVKQQHTVEGLFNRIMGEVETVGMATNWLYFAHQDFENRLGRLTMQTMQNHRDMYRSMEAIAPMTERLLEEFKRLHARVGLLENRLARLYNHAIVGGMPTPSRPTDKGMGHGHDDTADATATSTSSYTASSSTSTSASTTSLPLSTSSPTSSSSSTPTAFASSSVSDEKKQEIRRLGGTSSGKDYAGESRLPMADAEVRTDFLVEMLHGRHSRKGVPLRTSSRDEGEEEKAEPEELRDDERQSAAAILQATHQNHRNAWVRTCENERIDQNLESLEYEEARFSRIWDGQRTKAVRNLRTASGLMSILTPRLAQGEALAREMEANVVPAGHEGVVPLLQIKFEKPIDEMSEAEMREVLKSLPATIALDSRLLRGLRVRDDRYGRDDEDKGEYDEDEDDEDIDDEDKEGEGPEEEEAPPPRADKGKAREVPASSIPLHGGMHHAPSRAVRFGEASFGGGAGATWPNPAYPGAGPTVAGGHFRGAHGMPSNQREAAGTPSSGEIAQRRTVPEDPITAQPPSTASKKRGRSPDGLSSAEDTGVLDSSAREEDGSAKKRKLC